MRTFMSAIGAKAAFSLLLGASLIGTAGSSMAATGTALTSNITSLTAPGWTIGSQAGGTVKMSTDTAKNLNGGKTTLVGTYPTAAGSVYVWGAYDVASLKTNDLYIEFWAKMPNAKHGLKFLKIFGGTSGGGAANTTFALDYTGGDNGSMYQVSFGDGTAIANDTQNAINFDGSFPAWVGRSNGKATISTPQKSGWGSKNWGTSWHHFKFHVKFNSGTSSANEVADGAYYVEIDDKVYVDAKGLFNRHPSNAPIDRVELFGWTQGGSTPFDIWYADVTISTQGFVSSSTAPTSAPVAPVLKVNQQ